MITFEQMCKKLNVNGKCHFLIFGFEDDVDFKNPKSTDWYFDMEDWKNGKICPNRTISFKKFGVHRREMTKIMLEEYRVLMEKYWKEFEETNSSGKNQNSVIQEIRKKHPSAYKAWSKLDHELLSKFWQDKSNEQSEDGKIHEFSIRFGRNEGAIRSKLHKLGFLTDWKK